jgi:hypothetical protein
MRVFVKKARRIHLLLATVAGVLLFLTMAGADAPVTLGQGPAQAEDEPLTVKAGVYILSIGQLNTATGTYVVDMYLTLDCSAPCGDNSFEFMNGRATSTDLVESEPNYKSYRIQASLQTNPDLRQYPFDQQNLVILFEDKSRSKGHLVYQVAPELNGVDSSVIIAGWQLADSAAKVIDHDYPTFDTTYSRFQFDVIIARGTLSSIFKAVLPALFIVSGGFLALLLGPDKALHRLGINTSAVIGGIMFHINLTSQLPPLGYLTLADKFMIVNYVGLIGALVATVVLLMMTTNDKDQSKSELAVHRVSAISIPAVWAIGQVLVFTFR